VARGATRLRFIGVFIGLISFGGLVIAEGAFAAPRARMEDPFEITADRIDYDGSRNLYVAAGDVRVVQGERQLRARWVAFSTTTGVGVAEGAVDLVDGPDQMQAAFMVFDIKTLMGMLFQSNVDTGSNGFRIRAAEMIRTGKNTFTTRDGVFSTCRCEEGERLPWQLSTSEAKVELGGYGTITNSTFDVLGVPVLWIPWAFFPVMSERETGFLLPDFQVGGRNGVGIGLPFFWAVHPQVNLILTPRYMSERGYKQDVEVEYLFGRRSEGRLFVSGLNDGYNDNSGATDPERWGVKWEHDQFLPAKWRWQTDANVTSDNFYSNDFQEFRQYRSFRFIESTTNVARDFGASGGIGAMVGARWADDVQGFSVGGADPDFVDSDDFIQQRFVEARSDVQPETVLAPFGIQARFDSELIYFGSLRDPDDIFEDQEGGIRQVTDGRFWDVGVDTVLIPNPTDIGEGDGIFQEGEAVAERGARVVLHPRLARVFKLGGLAEFVPEVGWSQTFYKTDRQDYAQRGLLTGRMELRSRLARDYRAPRGGLIRHVLEPRLGWALVSQQQQRGNPIFVPPGSVPQSRLRTLSLENVTRNPSDRIESANQVVLGLGQRFFRRRGARGAPALEAELLTTVDWDFAEQGLGNLTLEGRIFRLGPFAAKLRGAFDPEAAALDEGFFELNFGRRLSNPWVRMLRLRGDYRYRRRVPAFYESSRGSAEIGKVGSVNQISFAAGIELTARFRLRYSTVIKLAGKNEFIRNEGTVEYASKCRCWGIGASVFDESRDGIGGGFTIRFLGLGNEQSDLFGGGFGTGARF
jgi:lipopolysaccharide assembly outer membrane protein LptD (OstA)